MEKKKKTSHCCHTTRHNIASHFWTIPCRGATFPQLPLLLLLRYLFFFFVVLVSVFFYLFIYYYYYFFFMFPCFVTPILHHSWVSDMIFLVNLLVSPHIFGNGMIDTYIEEFSFFFFFPVILEYGWKLESCTNINICVLVNLIVEYFFLSFFFNCWISLSWINVRNSFLPYSFLFPFNFLIC